MQNQSSIFRHLVDILKSIDDDLILPLRKHEKEERGGFFSISRQVFCYVDYLGALASNGKNTSDNAIAYMEEYFTQANPKYSGKCDLMYSMWRHGTVHEYDPKAYKSVSKNFQLGWGANNSSKRHNRDSHLECFCKKEKPDNYFWFINLFELVEDLKESVTHLIRDLEFDQAFLNKSRGNLQKMSKVIDLDKKTKSNWLTEAERVVNSAAGVIAKDGQVIQRFEDSSELEVFKKKHWVK
jgi:hypothetical protein